MAYVLCGLSGEASAFRAFWVYACPHIRRQHCTISGYAGHAVKHVAAQCHQAESSLLLQHKVCLAVSGPLPELLQACLCCRACLVHVHHHKTSYQSAIRLYRLMHVAQQDEIHCSLTGLALRCCSCYCTLLLCVCPSIKVQMTRQIGWLEGYLEGWFLQATCACSVDSHSHVH